MIIRKLENLSEDLQFTNTLERLQVMLETEFTSILGYISECSKIGQLHKIDGVIFQMIPRFWKTELKMIPEFIKETAGLEEELEYHETKTNEQENYSDVDLESQKEDRDLIDHRYNKQ